jgi:6-phosphogluconolactonase
MTAKRPEIVVLPNVSALADTAAKRLASILAGAGPKTAVCLTGGSTPKPVYQHLATQPYLGQLPWNSIHWFWGDDRFVPITDERSNSAMARSAFLDLLPTPSTTIHPIPTSARDHQEAAQQYEQELKHFYGRSHLDPARPLFEVVLLGLGSDGHTASLFPGDSALEEKERWVVGVDQAGLAPFVPRVTLTFPTLASTRHMIFLVSGKDKRDVVARVLSGEDLPAARAQTHANGSVVWLIDQAAAN